MTKTESTLTAKQNDMGQWVSLIMLLIRRDLKIRYRSSVLGYLWSMLNPLLMMTILTIVFSHAMKVQLEFYPLYILSGLLCWNMFAQSIHNGVNSIVDNASLLKKVSVPSWVFPAATIGSAFVHFCFALIPYGVIAAFMGFYFGAGIVQFPFVIMLFFVFILGLILVLSSLNVFFRDISHVMEPVLQIGFYGSPILYVSSILPERFQFILKLNPIIYYLKGFRSSLYQAELLTWQQWAAMVVLAFASLGFGLFVYAKSRDKFLYYI